MLSFVINSDSRLLSVASKTKEKQEATMASHRHNDCKVPAKSIKKRIPLAEHSLSKYQLTSQKTVKNIERKTVSTSRIPVYVGRKIPGGGLLNLKGKSNLCVSSILLAEHVI